METQRIAKVIARSGLCSRREAERWIEQGRVSVNGTVLASPACTVSEQDTILVDGKPLSAAKETRLWLFHKPKGCITSHKDPEGRTTVFDLLPRDMGHIISIGRLDYNTEGLLLLTNDGELARHLELPSTGWIRRYRLRAYGSLDAAKLDKLRQGITIEGVRYAPAAIDIESSKGENHWLVIAITEGKNREVRKLMDYAGLTVNRLIRLAYGPFQLGKLEVKALREVPRKTLREQIGFQDR